METLKSIGILAGGGSLPTRIIQHLESQEIPFHVVTFKGQPKPRNINLTQISHAEFGLGAIKKVLASLAKNNVKQVVMAGNLDKPSFFDLKIDMVGLKLLKDLAMAHDDALLSLVASILENEGFQLKGAHELLPQIVAKSGVYGKTAPNEDDLLDIKLGMNVNKALGRLDIGQSVVVKQKVVLGVEAVEGTNTLITRCAALRGNNKGGILVKAAKPSQDLRFDMPTIGPSTIEKLAAHGYRGLAIQAEKTILLDEAEVVKAANKAKMFIMGIK